jgi:Uma2 family endonuclease
MLSGELTMTTVTTWGPIAAAAPLPPEDTLYEIVDGRYVELPPMSVYAGVIASRLVQLLGTFATSHQLGQVVAEVLFGLTPRARRKYRPDVAFVSYRKWAKDRPLPTTDPWPVVPELAVEVISPTDPAEAVQTKVVEYLQGGVQLVWVIYPVLGWVLIYESQQRVRGLTVADELDAEPVLPGFRLPLRELFTQPPAPPDGAESPADSGPTG